MLRPPKGGLLLYPYSEPMRGSSNTLAITPLETAVALIKPIMRGAFDARFSVVLGGRK